MSYKHLSIVEREKILFYLAQDLSLCQIAKLLGRNKSTISRELKRNSGEYLPSKAQANYHKRRKKSCRHKLLTKPELFVLVKKLFLALHCSPEQIAARLKLENYPIQISYKTIYRAIYAGMFDTIQQRRSKGNRGAIRHLRHKGKSRHSKNYEERRGKIPVSNELSARPKEAAKQVGRISRRIQFLDKSTSEKMFWLQNSLENLFFHLVALYLTIQYIKSTFQLERCFQTVDKKHLLVIIKLGGVFYV